MLLSVRQAAARLGIGYSTLKQWIYQGRVRTRTTSGGHHRIAEAEVDRLLAPSTAPPPRAAAGGRDHPTRLPGAIVALSGRNQLRGYVDEVRVEGLLAQVRLRIGDQLLTAVITRDAIDELKLRRGDDAVAIIKSTEVMIGRQAEPPLRRRPRRRRRIGATRAKERSR
jgi:molybdopterin-binding protein